MGDRGARAAHARLSGDGGRDRAYPRRDGRTDPGWRLGRGGRRAFAALALRRARRDVPAAPARDPSRALSRGDGEQAARRRRSRRWCCVCGRRARAAPLALAADVPARVLPHRGNRARVPRRRGLPGIREDRGRRSSGSSAALLGRGERRSDHLPDERGHLFTRHSRRRDARAGGGRQLAASRCAPRCCSRCCRSTCGSPPPRTCSCKRSRSGCGRSRCSPRTSARAAARMSLLRRPRRLARDANAAGDDLLPGRGGGVPRLRRAARLAPAVRMADGPSPARRWQSCSFRTRSTCCTRCGRRVRRPSHVPLRRPLPRRPCCSSIRGSRR